MRRYYAGKYNLPRIFLLLLVVNTALSQMKDEPACGTLPGDKTNATVYCFALQTFNSIHMFIPEAQRFNILIINWSPNLVLSPEYFRSPLFGNLSEIHLMYNNNYLTINPATFSGIPTLRGLLIECPITEINSESFTGLENLEKVGVTGTSIKTIRIAPDTFRKLTKLRSLSLQNNNMETIPTDFLLGSETLKILNLLNNRLKSIDKDTFRGAINLEEIQLNSNRIAYIDVEYFTSLLELSKLHLGFNNLQHLKAGLFDSNLKLNYLDLSWNNLTDLRKYPLNSSSLTTLRMNHGGIESIPVNFFSNVPNLQFIEFMNNNIVEIHPEVFAGLHNISRMQLNVNHLTSLGVDTLKKLHNLVNPTRDDVGLILGGNNFDCTSDVMNVTREYCFKNDIDFYALFKCRNLSDSK